MSGFAGLADAGDAAAADADVGLEDARVVENDGVDDDGIEGTFGARALALPHAVADHLAAAELDLLAIDRVVFLDLDDRFGVGKPQPVARRRPEHRGIGRARQPCRHDQSAPLIWPLKPTTRRPPA